MADILEFWGQNIILMSRQYSELYTIEFSKGTLFCILTRWQLFVLIQTKSPIQNAIFRHSMMNKIGVENYDVTMCEIKGIESLMSTKRQTFNSLKWINVTICP